MTNTPTESAAAIQPLMGLLTAPNYASIQPLMDSTLAYTVHNMIHIFFI